MENTQSRFALLWYVARAGCKEGWQLLKVQVKLVIRYEPDRENYLKLFRVHHQTRLTFYGRLFLHLAGLRRVNSITCASGEPGEGPGGQAFGQMAVVNFARASGLCYVHSPFIVLAGADRSMQDWIATWESVFNLGVNEAYRNPCSRGSVNCAHNTDIDLCFGWGGRTDELVASFKTLIPEFRSKYYMNKSPRVHDGVIFGVNVRRCEVSAEQHAYMYTATEKIIRIVKRVKSELDLQGIRYRLCVYGQGDSAEFSELEDLGAEFFLNADAVWTMHKLVEADVLIVAKSNFSYYAGMISDGIKVFEPCAFPRLGDGIPGQPPAWGWSLFAELDGWLPCAEDGSIDRAAFEECVTRLLERRTAATGERVQQDEHFLC